MQKYLRISHDGVNERQMSITIKVAVEFADLYNFKMSRITSHLPLWSTYIALLLFTLILTSMTLQQVGASPLPDLINNHENSTEISTDITTNMTDVYVIKAIVYEIGILADEDNTTISESTEGQEKINISWYNLPQEDEFS